VDGLVEERRRVVGAEARAAQTWTPELDALLDPCREAADSLGFYMTPILVVNGIVKHHGSVSTVEQIGEWLVSA
jgi:Thioredoxin domain